MPEYCSCGAQLPPDALFCHKCGKPQRDIVVPETVLPPPPPPIAPQVQVVREARPLNFRNGPALRIALLVAAMATLLFFLPYVNWFAAGYFAVFFYRRRTGYLLNFESGVRLGWITGLLMFGIMACLLALLVVFLRSPDGMAAFQAQVKDPRFLDTLKLLQNGREVAILLVEIFFLCTTLSAMGGALGAKIVGRS